VGLIGRSAVVDFVARQVFDRAAAVTAVSSYLRQSLEQHVPALDGRVSVIPMPVHSVFADNGRPSANGTAQQRTILAAGRLSKQKGFHNLITAAYMLRERGLATKVQLIGNGEEEKALRALADRMHVHDTVDFLGGKTAYELADYYHACDVAVLPSHDEGLGLTLVEAMFCGAPVIGSRSGGITDLIADGETGLLVPPGDPQALADALERLLSDHAYASQLGRTGQEYVRHAFDPATCIDAMERVYQDVLHDGHATEFTEP
jgi:glycosyltransferase involved in cell wall biosynthesis